MSTGCYLWTVDRWSYWCCHSCCRFLGYSFWFLV